MEASNQQRTAVSFLDVLHEAPTLLEELPLVQLKNLSATCRSLRTSFCARIRVMTFADPADASNISCTTWPQLVMTTCTPGKWMKSKLSSQWGYLLEMSLPDASAMLIRSLQELRTAAIDLSMQHCAALSAFADKHRHTTRQLSLRGPLAGCQAIQVLTQDTWPVLGSLALCDSPHQGWESMSHLSKSMRSVDSVCIVDSCLDGSGLLTLVTEWSQLKLLKLSNNQLDPNALSAISQANWPNLGYFVLSYDVLGVAGTRQLVFCSWPLLTTLILDHACIDEPAISCLAQGQFPALTWLSLKGNNVNIDAAGISYLVQGNWPKLMMLILSDQCLDQAAYSLLGISKPEQQRVAECTQSCVSTTSAYLPQLPNLRMEWGSDLEAVGV